MSGHFNKYVSTISKLIIAISIGVLIGWQFNITALKSVLPGLIAMNPFTALGFIATALWQWLRLKVGQQNQKISSALAAVLAFFVFATGAFKLFDLMTDTDYAFDNILYPDRIGEHRMSQLTAFNFVMFGAGMMLSGLRTQKGNLILYFITPVFTLSIISLFGYVIGSNNVHTLKPFKPMAVHSTVCFLALVLSFLLLFRENSIMKMLLSPDSGGYIARKLLPYVLLVPFALGYVRYHGERLELYDTGFGVAIFMASAILIFMLVVVRQSRALSEIDKGRSDAEKKVEQRSKEVESANIELGRRNKELEQFAYAASHDMQEPLRKIETFSSFLLQNPSEHLNEREIDYLKRIGTSVARMKNIIDDLLNYSHYTRDDEVFVPTNLCHVIENIETDLELAIMEKGAVIRKEQLPVINAIPSQMHQLFYNLITNALKFSTADVSPQITVSCTGLAPEQVKKLPKLDEKKRYIAINVSDNGIGFEQAHADKIFNLFSRLHSKNQYAGTGIGLALCKKVVENHNGTICAKSQPGKGATFTVILPED
jgi:signal transduction histidine kinase